MLIHEKKYVKPVRWTDSNKIKGKIMREAQPVYGSSSTLSPKLSNGFTFAPLTTTLWYLQLVTTSSEQHNKKKWKQKILTQNNKDKNFGLRKTNRAYSWILLLIIEWTKYRSMNGFLYVVKNSDQASLKNGKWSERSCIMYMVVM